MKLSKGEELLKAYIENLVATNTKLVVTPSFYKILEEKTSKRWAKSHCFINSPIPQAKT